MGRKDIWDINNNERNDEYMINGNRIERIERKYGKPKGVYRFEDKLITWINEDYPIKSYVWVRPGI